MVQFNGQISDLSIQQNGRVTILLQKEHISHEATEGYLTRNITTRSLQKELGNLIDNRDISRIKNDNSEDKVLFITNGFKNRRLHILQDPTNSVLR